MSDCIYGQIHDPIEATTRLGKAICLSGMFGVQTEAQGFVIAFHCLQTKKPLLEFQAEYHLVEGKPSMKAEAMLAKFSKLGGQYRWLTGNGDDTKAEIEVSFGKNEKMVVAYSVDDAKKAGLIKADKPGSGWNKNRSSMLRARVVSTAIRMVCPEAIVGCYTPEELEDLDDAPSPSAEPVAPRKTRAKAEATPEKAVTPPADVQQAVAEPEVAPAKSSVPEVEQAAEPTPSVAPQLSTAQPATSPEYWDNGAKVATINSAAELKAELQITDQGWQKLLTMMEFPVNAQGVRKANLGTFDQAEKLLGWLQKKKQEVAAKATTKSLNEWANSATQSA